MKTKIIYIAGYGHSGSTLLGKILGTSSNSIYVGELQSLLVWIKKNHKYINDYSCDCGKELNECNLWSPVIKAIDLSEIYNPKTNFNKKKEVFNKLIRSNDLFTREDKLYHKILQISKEEKSPEVEYIVDSSKNVRRIIDLLKYSDLDLTVIHVVRDVRGILWSRIKTKSIPIKCLFDWFITNLLISITRIRYGKKLNFMRVSYDSFTKDPVNYMKSFNSKLGLKLYVDLGYLIKQLNEEKFHSFCGSLGRKKKITKIRQDVGWKKHLSFVQKILTTTIFLIPLWLWVKRKDDFEKK